MEMSHPGSTTSKAYMQVMVSIVPMGEDVGSRREAIQWLDRFLTTRERFLEKEIFLVERSRNIWVYSLNPDFQPVQHARELAFEVLKVKCRDSQSTRDYEAPLSYTWQCLQCSIAGTIVFCNALSDLADCAALAGERLLAKQVAQMYHMHFELLYFCALEARSKRSTTYAGLTGMCGLLTPQISQKWMT